MVENATAAAFVLRSHEANAARNAVETIVLPISWYRTCLTRWKIRPKNNIPPARPNEIVV